MDGSPSTFGSSTGWKEALPKWTRQSWFVGGKDFVKTERYAVDWRPLDPFCWWRKNADASYSAASWSDWLKSLHLQFRWFVTASADETPKLENRPYPGSRLFWINRETFLSILSADRFVDGESKSGRFQFDSSFGCSSGSDWGNSQSKLLVLSEMTSVGLSSLLDEMPADPKGEKDEFSCWWMFPDCARRKIIHFLLDFSEFLFHLLTFQLNNFENFCWVDRKTRNRLFFFNGFWWFGIGNWRYCRGCCGCLAIYVRLGRRNDPYILLPIKIVTYYFLMVVFRTYSFVKIDV